MAFQNNGEWRWTILNSFESIQSNIEMHETDCRNRGMEGSKSKLDGQ